MPAEPRVSYAQRLKDIQKGEPMYDKSYSVRFPLAREEGMLAEIVQEDSSASAYLNRVTQQYQDVQQGGAVILLPPDWFQRFQETAARLGFSPNELAKVIVTEHLGEYEKRAEGVPQNEDRREGGHKKAK
jgi:hypothetical protein